MKNTSILLAVICALLLSLPGRGQSSIVQPAGDLIGHWEGAFIKNNAYQKIDIQFFLMGESLFSLQIMEEWHPQFGEFQIPVGVDSNGTITLNTGLGKAILQLDEYNLEMTGQIEGSLPAIYLHLKKAPDPAAPHYTIDPVEVANGDVVLKGHLHRPLARNARTAVIIVGGRGCGSAPTQFDLYAKFLREYGVSVLAYHKRGNGNSNGDCSTSKIGDLASDVSAWHAFLSDHPDGFEKIGVIGSSAGGWVMIKAQETTPFDFLISIVGPSTSVREQQYQSLAYGAKFYDLSMEAVEQVKAYTDLVFDAPATQASLDRFNSLLSTAEMNNWRNLLEGTDIPQTINDIDGLWVRRHDYDPGPVLADLQSPFLAIYGEKDWIVPPKENIDKLNQFFPGSRQDLLTTVLARGAEHGMEMEGEFVNLGQNRSYWHFYRISPQVLIEVVKFLRKHQLID